MKKSNAIMAAILAVVSAGLLGAWYGLGLNKVDEPLDLVVSVIWWVAIVAGVAIVTRMESTRRERVRTVYVADGRIYNSETGTRSVAAGTSIVDSIAAVLGSLKYDFTNIAESPDASRRGGFRYVVRTSDYDEGTWTGEVVNVATGNAVPFSSKAELARIVE